MFWGNSAFIVGKNLLKISHKETKIKFTEVGLVSSLLTLTMIFSSGFKIPSLFRNRMIRTYQALTIINELQEAFGKYEVLPWKKQSLLF